MAICFALAPHLSPDGSGPQKNSPNSIHKNNARLQNFGILLIQNQDVSFYEGFGSGIPWSGTKDGLEIWRIENFKPVPVAASSYGKFYMGDSYIILKTAALKNGSFRHDHPTGLGKILDEAGTAAILTVELDAALEGVLVQYREMQGNETESFSHYLDLASCHSQEGQLLGSCGSFIPINHDDIFILDTKSKIFQFNGSNSCIQERAKALEVVQYIKDTFMRASVKLQLLRWKVMADVEAGEFWGLFGGFCSSAKEGILTG
ncbi:hypothetical protein EJB05_51902 [Eragrostis curvula]|uniref:Gelsolin-like domain-containing protein n=1 Tax=Eragrostis curvula TaxID=38414 RepID=A0A5J9SUG8_9POAL|nr:hypothetical protein EJB05_51902 [Eragrostis curvula]